MVKVKGVEWNHVVVLKEPEKHGMATLVKCAHCHKEFQGNAMRIRAHLLGNKRSAGVSGCPSCPEDAREELRIVDQAKSLTKRKREARRGGMRPPPPPPSSATFENGSDISNGMPMELMGASLHKGEKTAAMEQAFRNMVFQAGAVPVNFVGAASPFKPGPGATATDLETFFEGFGVREETIAKIKELGFTGKTFMSNLDELPLLFESIKQHCHLTVGEEWGIKGAAKKWQKDYSLVFAQPDVEKWQEPENGAMNSGKELLCLAQS